jgi:hypothetical protein
MYNILNSSTFCSTAISSSALHANHPSSLPLVLSHPVGNPQMPHSLTTPPSIPGTPSLHLSSTTLDRDARIITTDVIQSHHRSMWLGPQSLSTIQSHDTVNRKTEEPSLHITRVT